MRIFIVHVPYLSAPLRRCFIFTRKVYLASHGNRYMRCLSLLFPGYVIADTINAVSRVHRQENLLHASGCITLTLCGISHSTLSLVYRVSRVHSSSWKSYPLLLKPGSRMPVGYSYPPSYAFPYVPFTLEQPLEISQRIQF